MSRSFKVAALCAVTALVLAMPLAAQNATEELGPLESNTYKATSGLFGNDVDNFVDVHSYGDVAPEKWFGFVTGRPLSIAGQGQIPYYRPGKADNPTTGLLSLGYARNFGGIYLGLWYQGNVAQVTGGWDAKDNKNVTKTSSIDPKYDAYKTVTETKEELSWQESWINSSNQIEALIGVSGQGIKIGFYESLYNNAHQGAVTRVDTNGRWNDYVKGTDDKNDKYSPDPPYQFTQAGTAVKTEITNHQNGIVDYKAATDEFYVKGGYIRPYLGWGSTFAIGANSLRPFVNLGATFGSDTKVDNYSDYTQYKGVKYGKTNDVGMGYDYSYIKPEVGIGTWVDLAAGEGAKASTTLGIEYNLGVYIYNSSYAGTGLAGDNIAGVIDWGDTASTAYVNRKTTTLSGSTSSTDINLDIAERSAMTHELKPTYIISGEAADNLSLGFKASLPVGVRTSSIDQHRERHVISETKYNTDKDRNTKTVTITQTRFQSVEELNVGLGLDLAIGASYKLVPSRLSVNAGVSATPLSFVNTVRTYKTPANSKIETIKTTDGLGNTRTNSKTVDTMPQGGVTAEDWLIQKDQVESDLIWQGFSGNVTGGFTFFFTPGIALDLAAAWGKDSFNVDIADVNVLFSFKF